MSMRITLLALLAACGGGGVDGLPPPDDCGPGELHFIHDLDNGDGEGFETISNFLFFNAINGENGGLAVGMDGGTQIAVEFPELSDGTVSARGRVQTTGIAAGNCETGSFSGQLSQGKTSAGTDMWSFTLVDLHAEPFCGGAAITGSFAACFGSTSD
jgi:hypothetical protein